MWESIFLGKSIIVNRQSGEHFDKWGIRKGFDVLLAAGDFTGGEITFKDLNLRTAFLPGTAVFFDGTAYRHSIGNWQGKQRISNALFVHGSIFKQLEIDATLLLVNIRDVRDTITQVEAERFSWSGLKRERADSIPSSSNIKACHN
jgi:hypothetical protein